MKTWHTTEDAPRIPNIVRPGDLVEIWVGSYPIEPGQCVSIEIASVHANGDSDRERIPAFWRYNDFGLANSYWQVMVGPFMKGDRVEYVVHGKSGQADAALLGFAFEVND